MDNNTPRKTLFALPEYRYITNPKRKKFLAATLVDGLAPTTAAKLLGLNATREAQHSEVVNCWAAFKEKADPRQEIIDFWQGVFDLDYGPGVKSAAKEDKRQPLPDPKTSKAGIDECERRYEEQKAASQGTK